MAERILEVGTQLNDPGSRRDLAWEVIAVMFHPKDVQGQRRRQSAGAAELLGERDGKTDDKEVEGRARSRWKKMGGFKTNRRAEQYPKQQLAAGRQVSSLLMVGDLIGIVWSLAAHHAPVLTGGSSVSKAIAIVRAATDSAVSERTLWDAWMRYMPVAHLCAAFAFRYRQADPECIDEYMTRAFDEGLRRTLIVAASFQRFGNSFRPHGTDKALLDPAKTGCSVGSSRMTVSYRRHSRPY